MAFNISIGDFISTIDLLIKIVGALDQAHGAAPQFQHLTGTLQSLQHALKDTDAFDSNPDALSTIIKRTEGSIERFLKKIAKYQPSLQVGGSKNKWRDAMRKVQWSLCQKDDVSTFQNEISLEVSSIQLHLLGACRTALTTNKSMIMDMQHRMDSTDAHVKETHTLLTAVNASFLKYAGQLSALMQSIFRANVSILSALLYQGARFGLPTAVRWDKPVAFQDATGRRFPINVGFINCWESFEFALLNLHKGRPGFDAVERHQYVLHKVTESGKWAQIHHNVEFDKAFIPGCSIDMTAMVSCEPYDDTGCPSCGWPEESNMEVSRIKCQNPECELTFVKSEYLRTHILTLPPTFELPPLPLLSPEKERFGPAQEQSL